MALTSSSNVADAIAQYQDNLIWEGSTAKARLALEAVRFLLIARPTSMTTQSRSLSFDALVSEKAKLETFVAQRSGTRAGFVQGRPRMQ